MKTLHPSQTPEYWERLALEERTLAASERHLPWVTAESTRVREQNAREYDETARRLREGAAA